MELRRGLWRERGQSLVVVTLMLVVLVGFLGLVVDVGNLYAQRRFMQNAADAAALAGARALAVEDPAVQYVVSDYATRGNAGAQTVISDIQESTVAVTVTRVVSTYFMSIMGIQTNTVQAAAQAGYCPLSSPSGIMPFGVFKDNIKFGCTSVVWDSLTVENIPDPPPGWNIAKDNLIQEPYRGWINLTGFTGTGTPDAKTLNEELAGAVGYPTNVTPWKGVVELGTYDGDTGSKITVMGNLLNWFDAVKDGDPRALDVIIPVYDEYKDLGGNKATFHISGFAVFHVTDVWKTGSEKYVAGYFKPDVPGVSLQKQAHCGGTDYGARIIELQR